MQEGEAMGSHMDENNHDKEKDLVNITVDSDQSKRKQEKIVDFVEKLRQINEAMSFLDYSFERAFTMQEKQYTAAYAVSSSFPLSHNPIDHLLLPAVADHLSTALFVVLNTGTQ